MAKQNQPSFFGVTTNGLLTKRIVDTVEKILAECRTSYLKIGVSLDGIREVHDDIRQHNGSFTQAVKTIEALASLRAKYKNLFIYVSTTLTRSNAPTIKQMIDEISALPVDAHYLGYIRGEPQDETENDVSLEAYREVSAYLDRKWESRRDVFGFLNILNSTVRKVNAEILENNSYLFPCVAGRKMLTFSEDGKVLPCEILDQKNEGGFTMGDIREFNYDVNKLLSSPKARSISDWITQEKCRCTFECANQASLAYQPLSFIKTITKLRKQN
jgi:radical SAM protein with 4Fe4S-binding SPASM domain